MEDNLAIVIPAYKINYLDTALASIAAQTNKNFSVYICDDGSPDNIKAVVDKYNGGFNLLYHRFPDNLGKTDLVKHWDRCVNLTNENWIWLFSDDDVMSPECTQTFFDTLTSTGGRHNLYRFNIEMIDNNGQVICAKESHPLKESAYQFLQRRLQLKSLSAAVEYIFNRSVFEKNNGFINLPLAWCADDASWIRFAGSKKIYTMQLAKVYWRASGINLSSAPGFQTQKLDALVKFIDFILKEFPDKQRELLSLAERWFYENLTYLNGRLSFRQFFTLSGKLTTLFGGSKTAALKILIALQLRNTRFAASTQKWLRF